MQDKYDWKSAQAFYIEAGWLSGVSFLTVSNKFNIPYQTVRRKAASERWRLIREWQSTEPELKSVDEYIYYCK
ncbi:hypothetical protein ABEO79_00240 [Micromonospora provocatoris]